MIPTLRPRGGFLLEWKQLYITKNMDMLAPDVLWYNPNLDSFTLDDLKASKYYSPTDRETIKCSQTNTVFQSVANTLYEKGAMQLRLYYEALKDQNTFQAIRAQFGKTSVRYPI
eukprot:g31710.t1